MRLEGFGKLKEFYDLIGSPTSTFRLVADLLSNICYRGAPGIIVIAAIKIRTLELEVMSMKVETVSYLNVLGANLGWEIGYSVEMSWYPHTFSETRWAN
jgi:hypothetical protein